MRYSNPDSFHARARRGDTHCACVQSSPWRPADSHLGDAGLEHQASGLLSPPRGNVAIPVASWEAPPTYANPSHSHDSARTRLAHQYFKLHTPIEGPPFLRAV